MLKLNKVVRTNHYCNFNCNYTHFSLLLLRIKANTKPDANYDYDLESEHFYVHICGL